MTPPPLAHRKLLVTGASRGIGRAISEHLLALGAQVVGIARHFDPPWLEKTGFHPRPMDLARLDELEEALRGMLEAHPDLDGAISNAGTGRFGSLEEFSGDQIRSLVDLNLTQHLLLARTLLPHFKGRGHGDLLFMGSESALTGGMRGAVYSACKFGLRGLAQALRKECSGAGVRVGIFNPGMVASSFFDELDFQPGEAPENAIPPAEVARAVGFCLTAPPGVVYDEFDFSPLKKVIRRRDTGTGK